MRFVASTAFFEAEEGSEYPSARCLNILSPRADSVRRIQRRNYVRVQVLKTVKYKLEEEESWCEATTLDISGGGMKIKARRKFKLNDKLVAKIETSSRLVETEVQIKRCEKVNTNEYIYGLEFTDINENRRDNIIKDVFLVMRKQREIM